MYAYLDGICVDLLHYFGSEYFDTPGTVFNFVLAKETSRNVYKNVLYGYENNPLSSANTSGKDMCLLLLS